MAASAELLRLSVESNSSIRLLGRGWCRDLCPRGISGAALASATAQSESDLARCLLSTCDPVQLLPSLLVNRAQCGVGNSGCSCLQSAPFPRS
ncbi:putative thiamine ABC transporter,permease protein [Vibrio cholerae]|nr:putative thiamine ABC transporter,permease protein [Vibrio cholerae]